MGNRVVHFEIEAKDKARATKFYEQAFGWEMQPQPEEYGGYVVVITGDPQKPGGINGGIYQEDEKKLNAFSCVIAVDDVEKAITDVKTAGGKVFGDNVTPDGQKLGEKMDIPGVGIYVKCEDTEGNRFTLLQPSSDMTKAKE